MDVECLLCHKRLFDAEGEPLLEWYPRCSLVNSVCGLVGQPPRHPYDARVHDKRVCSTPCGHVFHMSCIVRYMRQLPDAPVAPIQWTIPVWWDNLLHNYCPVCRAEISESTLRHIILPKSPEDDRIIRLKKRAEVLHKKNDRLAQQLNIRRANTADLPGEPHDWQDWNQWDDHRVPRGVGRPKTPGTGSEPQVETPGVINFLKVVGRALTPDLP